jgi:carbon-monoxide dehydrogenase medium subunit
MKPAPFEYYAPDSLPEALELLGRFGRDARPLAGGQSLVPILNFRVARPAVLIDLNRIDELAGVSRAGETLRIGAMTRQRVVELSPIVGSWAPLLAMALPHVAHVQIRNRGTIGGSLAHAAPAAELPSVMVALDAALHLRSRTSTRRVQAEAFFTGPFSTALAADELLVGIELPRADPRTRFAFDEMARRHGDAAQLGVAAALTIDAAGVCLTARLVALNTSRGPMRLARAEGELAGREVTPATIAEAGEAAAAEIEVIGDLHATPAYRRQLARALTRRTIARALSSSHATPDC